MAGNGRLKDLFRPLGTERFRQRFLVETSGQRSILLQYPDDFIKHEAAPSPDDFQRLPYLDRYAYCPTE